MQDNPEDTSPERPSVMRPSDDTWPRGVARSIVLICFVRMLEIQSTAADDPPDALTPSAPRVTDPTSLATNGTREASTGADDDAGNSSPSDEG